MGFSTNMRATASAVVSEVQSVCHSLKKVYAAYQTERYENWRDVSEKDQLIASTVFGLFCAGVGGMSIYLGSLGLASDSGFVNALSNYAIFSGIGYMVGGPFLFHYLIHKIKERILKENEMTSVHSRPSVQYEEELRIIFGSNDESLQRALLYRAQESNSNKPNTD